MALHKGQRASEELKAAAPARLFWGTKPATVELQVSRGGARAPAPSSPRDGRDGRDGDSDRRARVSCSVQSPTENRLTEAGFQDVFGVCRQRTFSPSSFVLQRMSQTYILKRLSYNARPPTSARLHHQTEESPLSPPAFIRQLRFHQHQFHFLTGKFGEKVTVMRFRGTADFYASLTSA